MTSVEKHSVVSIPLLYQAACNGVYGRRYEFDGGSITDALFVYLDGMPSLESVRAVDEDYRNRPLVCLSDVWESYIKKNYPHARTFQRYMMKPSCRFKFGGTICIPDGLRVAAFDEKAFALHPFSHGKNYPSYEAFRQHGVGAVVWEGDKIVASAASFISLNNEVEVDVSTEETYRGRGLATACVSFMLQDCAQRGMIVHWDAQNETSRHLAEKFVMCFLL